MKQQVFSITGTVIAKRSAAFVRTIFFYRSCRVRLCHCNLIGMLLKGLAFVPGGVLPYISHIGMCPPKGRVFAPFWSEKGYRFYSLWSEIGYGFQGNYGSVRT